MMRTDLAAECLRQSDSLPEGVFYTEQALQQGKITMVEIATEEAQRKIGKPMGLYVTLEASPFWEEDSASPQWIEAVAVGLRQFLPEQGTILVAGLGNREITPDALGPAVAEQVLVTRHLSETFPELRTVAAIAPNVLGKTGLEAAETIRAVTEEIKPSAVIVVDAMASASLEKSSAISAESPMWFSNALIAFSAPDVSAITLIITEPSAFSAIVSPPFT